MRSQFVLLIFKKGIHYGIFQIFVYGKVLSLISYFVSLGFSSSEFENNKFSDFCLSFPSEKRFSELPHIKRNLSKGSFFKNTFSRYSYSFAPIQVFHNYLKKNTECLYNVFVIKFTLSLTQRTNLPVSSKG